MATCPWAEFAATSAMLRELAAILSCWELELFITLPALEVIIEKVSV